MQQTAHVTMPHTAHFAHPQRNVLHVSVEQGASVADFGAGSGHYVWPIAERVGETGRVFAIDVQQDLLKRIHNEARRRGLKNVHIVWADLEKPKSSKLADQSIDLVLISNVLFQLENKSVALREALRVLKPAGKLVVIDWAESFGGMGPHKKDVVTKDVALSLLNENEFAMVSEFPAGAHHWGVIAKPA